LGFGGERRGKKSLWRGKPLFESFKKIGKDFGGERKAYGDVNPCLRVLKKYGKVLGVLKGFICLILKFP